MRSQLRQLLDLLHRWFSPGSARRSPWSGTTRSKRYKYEATVTLLPQQADGAEAALPGPVCHAVVRANHLETHHSKLFSALVTCDGQPRGQAPIHVTMVVVGDDAGDYLSPGEHFSLLRGADVARGTVTRRVFV